MQRLLNHVLAFLFFSASNVSAADVPTELCNLSTQISTMFSDDGPLKGCRNGDVVHFIVDKTRVSPATVAARYCNFTHQIITDTIAGNSLTHVVCKYQWKWAKDVQRQRHPDAQ